MTTSAEAFVGRFVSWARAREDVVAVALVGSHARGTPGPDSDLDVLTLSHAPSALLGDLSWFEAFGEVTERSVEHWGAVTSVRVVYEDALEVELGVAGVAWASTDPIDPGTARVVRDGLRILFDPAGCLQRLVDATGG